MSAPNEPDEMLRETAWIGRLARALVGDAGAGDVAQETWLAARGRRPAHVRDARAWLAAVARNVVRQERRAERRRVERERERETLLPRTAPPTDELCEQAELSRHVVRVVLELDEPYRRTLLLRYFRDLEPADVAALDGVPASTVRNRLRRGLAQVRERLDRDRGGRERGGRERGGRAAWAALLVPGWRGSSGPAIAPTASTAAALVLGGLVVKQLVLVAAALVLAVLGAVWLVARDGAQPSAPPALARAAPDDARLAAGERDAARHAHGAREPLAEPPAAASSGAGAASTPDAAAEPDGWVFDEVGAPLEGALVTLVDLPAIDATLTSTGVQARTDASGAFRFPAGAYTHGVDLLAAEHPGHVSIALDTPLRWPPRFALARAATVEGRVLDLDTRAPLAGAQVDFGCYGWRDGAMRSVATDADGRFRFDRAPRTEAFVVDVLVPGRVPAERRIGPVGGERGTYDLLVPAGRSVAGRVVLFESGAPVAGAAIRVGLREVARSDAGGRFVVAGLSDERVRFEAVAPGHAVTHAWLEPDDARRELVLPLVGACTLAGVVRSGAGEPVAGALVVLPLDRDAPASIALPAGVGLGRRSSLRSMRTDDAGSFRFDSLAPYVGYDSLRVTRSDTGVSARFEDVRFERPGEAREVELRFPDDGTVLRGRVTLDGEPLVALVRWRGASATALTTTADDGSYRFAGVEPGPVAVEALTDDLEREVELEIALGEERVVDLAIESPTTPLAGRVTTDAGEPVPDEWVFVTVTGAANVQARTDDEGRFRVALDAPSGAALTLRVMHGPVRSRFAAAAGREDLELVVPAIAALLVQVVDAASGSAVQDARFAWRFARDGAQAGDEVAEGEGWHDLTAYDVALRDDGSLALVLPARTLDLRVEAPERYAPALVRGVAVPGEDAPLRVELARAP